MVKKEFIMVVNDTQIPVLGHTHRNVALKYPHEKEKIPFNDERPCKG